MNERSSNRILPDSDGAMIDDVQRQVEEADKRAAGSHRPVDANASPVTTTAHPLGNDSGVAHPRQIGPYKILEHLGEGGMGIVYLAEQTEPFKRRVALKLIKLGMDTRQVIARFESERQALAMMSHQNVARALDAGATERGRPYFVMEYISGIPITDYCDRHQLETRQRLELFVSVCQAIQHAHQKGIIHRDIKPSNVLVMLEDGQPMPKVIDFGVAKATGRDLTEKTLFTAQGELIGTPDYMSPEQAEMTALNVDTRTDIYSLGVLLYELLVGVRPFDPQTLGAAGFAEIQRIIRETEPKRPSTRLSTLGDDSNAMSHRRQTEVRDLVRSLRGDLDWITMKALEKNRTLRYASASEFAADIERHLNDQPVMATPPSTFYWLRKLVRRRKVAIINAAVMLIVVLVAGASVKAYSDAQRVKREAIIDAQRAEQDAIIDAQEVEKLVLRGIEKTRNREWFAAEKALRDSLLIDADNAPALINLARLKILRYNELWGSANDQLLDELLDEANDYCKRALEFEPNNVRGLNVYGVLLKKLRRYDEAVQAYERIIELDSRDYAAWVNLATIRALNRDVSTAETHLLKASKLADMDEPRAVDVWRNLASLQHFLGKSDAAVGNLDDALECNKGDVATWTIYTRVLLDRDATEARIKAAVADQLGRRPSAKAKRMSALAFLRTDDYRGAIANAHFAIQLGDSVTVNELIMAVAEARLDHADDCRAHLETAEANWPSELKNAGDFSVDAETGILWFETWAELDRLRGEANQALSGTSP
jgi:serine/threonine protein kinase